MTRLVRVLPVAWPAAHGAGPDRTATIAGNIDQARWLLDAVAPGSADLVCLPEGFLYHRVWDEAAREETSGDQGPLLATIQAWARGLGAWLCVPMLRRTGTGLVNVVLVVDRQGAVAGDYEKMHPWPSTSDLTVFENGVHPGARAVAVPTEFGPVGVQTCFDVNWPTGWDQLRAQGCALIVFPSDYPGGFALRARAWQTRTPVVAAVLRGRSRVVDMTGEVIASVGPEDHPAVVGINLNRALVHLDHAWRRIQDLTRRDPRIQVRRLEHDNVVVLSAPADGPPIEELISRAGIRPLDTYLRQAKESIDADRRHLGEVAGVAQLRTEPGPAGTRGVPVRSRS